MLGKNGNTYHRWIYELFALCVPYVIESFGYDERQEFVNERVLHIVVGFIYDFARVTHVTH